MTPRGIRNKNLLNIRKSNIKWLGSNYAGRDDHFVTFTTYAWGIRAACCILHTYAGRGWVKVYDIIYHWAPPSDGNRTNDYINQVCLDCGFTPNSILDMHNRAQVCALLQAMAGVECGKAVLRTFNISEHVFKEGYKLWQDYR